VKRNSSTSRFVGPTISAPAGQSRDGWAGLAASRNGRAASMFVSRASASSARTPVLAPVRRSWGHPGVAGELAGVAELSTDAVVTVSIAPIRGFMGQYRRFDPRKPCGAWVVRGCGD
jgi:hypothetical protein